MNGEWFINSKIIYIKTECFYICVTGSSVIALDTKLVNAYKLNSCAQLVFCMNSVDLY